MKRTNFVKQFLMTAVFLMMMMGMVITAQAGNEIMEGDIILQGNKTVTGDLAILSGTIDLNGYTLTVRGDLVQEGAVVEVGSGVLNVGGNFLQKYGYMKVGTGALNVDGWYRIQDPDTAEAGEEYGPSGGILQMQHGDSRVNIKGDFVTQSINDYIRNNLYCGTMTIGGDLYQLNGNETNFVCQKDHVVVLNGYDQTVYFESSSAKISHLKVATSATIKWKNNMNVVWLESNVNIQPVDLVLPLGSELDMNGYSMTIHGELLKQYGSVNLNGGTLNIKGNLLHRQGFMTISNGTLNVDGWYRIQDPDNAEAGEAYGNSNGALRMLHGDGRVNVKGDFVTQSTNNYQSNSMNSGVMTVGGNFEEYLGNETNFKPAGDVHKVVLNGTGKQNVYLESEKAFFINLELMQDRSNYTFNRDNCWVNLIESAVLPGTLPHTHIWGSYRQTKAATALKKGSKVRYCTVEGCTEKETVSIAKLKPTMKVNMKTVKMQIGQTTTALKVSGLAKGDSVKKITSSNSKKVYVKLKGSKIILRAKGLGTAKLTIKLASGKVYKKAVTVKVGLFAVKTTKLKLNKTTVTLKKGKTFLLKTTRTPLTSTQKVYFRSKNKKIATVTSSGKIKGIKKGSTSIYVTSGKCRAVCKVKVR